MFLSNCLIFLFIVCAFAEVPYRARTKTGTPCLSVFSYKGKDFHDCTYEGSSTPWCYTSTGGDWDYCDKTLDKSCEIAQPNINSTGVKSVLEFLNNLRAKVSANRMAKLRWNSELAMRAQFMSDQCQLSSSNQKLCDNTHGFGQISYYSMSSAPQPHKWVDMIMQFYSKEAHYNIDSDSCSAGNCYGYKQIVAAQTTDVGCGVKSCNRDSIYQDYYFCTFYPPLFNGHKPYETGSKPCDACYKLSKTSSFKCSSGLCEVCESTESGCQGLEYWREQIRSGAVCEDIDSQYCNMIKDHCKVIEQLPAEHQTRIKADCRKTCGLC